MFRCRSLREFSVPLLIALFALSCYGYTPIRVVKQVDPAAHSEDPGADKKGIAAGEPAAKARYRAYRNKYLAEIRFAGAAARINNLGVEAAARGEFGEAQRLFEEAIAEDASLAAAYNNAAVVYELFGRGTDAFRMYARACILEPDNEYFRKNFLFQVDESEK